MDIKKMGKDVSSVRYGESHTRMLTIWNTKWVSSSILDNINEALHVCQWFIEFQREGSGWRLKNINMNIKMVSYQPLRGSGYIETPKRLKKYLRNGDEKCFMWAILSTLHPMPNSIESEWVESYIPFEHELVFEGISFLVAVDDVKRFEKLNSISVDVIAFQPIFNHFYHLLPILYWV